MGRADAGGDVSRAGERPVRVRSPALLAPCLLWKFTESVASCFQTVWRPRAREQGSDGMFPPWASFGCSCCWELLFARSHCDYSTQWRGWRYEQRVPLLGRPASLRPSASAQEEPAPPPGRLAGPSRLACQVSGPPFRLVPSLVFLRAVVGGHF